MARLSVKLRGEDISRLQLESGQEYIAGRSNDVQIVLANERGISRHHLKFFEREGVWVCESLSKFVLIQKGSQSLEVVELSEPTVFSVPPYDFYFEPDLAQESQSAAPAPSENLPAFYSPRVNANPNANPQTGAPAYETPQIANHEATMAGVSNLVPYFRISFPNTADDQTLKLEGHLWTAGRDQACEIFIDSPQVSRKHFELARTNEGFYITDLGSSNGTKHNGQRLPPHEPTRVESGDELQVRGITLVFEIRDTHFSHRMDNLPVPSFDPGLMAPPMPWYPDAQMAQMPAYPAEENPIPKDWKQWRPQHLKYVDWRKHKVRVALLVLAPVLLIVALMPEEKKAAAPRDPAMQSNSVVFENLSPEQKGVVKDSFHLAKNLYQQGKYELCLTELAKVHELIPQYENSKELQSFCEQGRELVHRQRDAERKERERAMIEQQISGYIETCKAKLSKTAGVDETRLCLADAMELAPEHPQIAEMLRSAQLHEDERKFNASQREEVAKAAARGRAHYTKARGLWKNGQLAKAVGEYEVFINKSYPSVENEKSSARRELASIRKELKTKVDFFVDQCKSLGQRNRFKEAYQACDKAIKEDPSQTDAKDYAKQMHSELKREMKSIYEDSVLEESLGNVDSAKEKWKKIIKENLSFDDYTKKAQGKLQKYGIGT